MDLFDERSNEFRSFFARHERKGKHMSEISFVTLYKNQRFVGHVVQDGKLAEKVANFLVCDPSADKMVTDFLDFPIVSTMGPFLDQCRPEFRDELLPYLLPLQQGRKTPKPLQFVRMDDDDLIEEGSVKAWQSIVQD